MTAQVQHPRSIGLDERLRDGLAVADGSGSIEWPPPLVVRDERLAPKRSDDPENVAKAAVVLQSTREELAPDPATIPPGRRERVAPPSPRERHHADQEAGGGKQKDGAETGGKTISNDVAGDPYGTRTRFSP